MTALGSPGHCRRSPSLAVTWAGHATALIELDGLRLLTDPILRDRVGPLVRIASRVQPGLSSCVDVVLVSHLHPDHADPRSLRRLPGSTLVLAPRGAGRWLRRHGLRHVEELDAGEHTEIQGVRVCATPAAHDGRRWPLGPGVPALGFLACGSQACYFAGDTDLHAGMSTLGARVDLALLPVWGWGPGLGPGHLDPIAATEAARRIAPRAVVPIHWGTFALAWHAARSPDPWAPARRFAELMREQLPAVDVRLLAPGARTELAATGGR